MMVWACVGRQVPMSQYTLEDFSSSGVQCPGCGRVFDTEAGCNRHRGAVHNGSQVDIECEQCGDTFTRPPSQADRARFCGKDCLQAWQSDNWRGSDAPAHTGSRKTTECETCGDEMEVWQYELDEGFGRYCSRECFHEFMRSRVGSEHPLWRGGKNLTDALRKSLGEWGSVRKTVRDRGGACEMCGSMSSGTGKAFDVHHIVPVNAGGCNVPELLMMLCRECHMKVESYTRNIPEVKPIYEYA